MTVPDEAREAMVEAVRGKRARPATPEEAVDSVLARLERYGWKCSVSYAHLPVGAGFCACGEPSEPVYRIRKDTP